MNSIGQLEGKTGEEVQHFLGKEQMPTDRVKLMRVILIGVLSCVFACVGIGILSEVFEEGSNQAPIRSLRVTIGKNQTEQLFDQLQKFAERYSFAYNLTDYGGQGKYCLVEIRGDSIKILANEASRGLTVFDISFFAPSPGDPLPDKKVVDNLVIDLIDLLREIPDVQISDEK